MSLSKRFDMTIALPRLSGAGLDIVCDVQKHEREFQHPLPDNSFYKSLAIDLIRRYAPRSEVK